MMKKSSFALTFMFVSLIPLMVMGEEFHRFHLDHKDGLLSNYVRNIGQDGRGFVWVATDNGLNRFDGRTFSSFTKENSGLPSNELNCILPDPRNKDVVWFGTRHHSICKYDYVTGKISSDNPPLHSPDIPFLSPSSDGKIWVTHYHFTPDKYDPATGEVERLFSETPNGFPVPIWCAVEDREGRYLYVGHVNGGLSQVDLSSKRFVNFNHKGDDPQSIGDNTVYTIMVDNEGLIWCGTGKGVSIFDPRTKEFINLFHSDHSQSILQGAVLTVREMRNGDIWIGTSEGGVSVLPHNRRIHKDYRFDNHNRSTTLDGQSMFASSFVRMIFEDSYGNKWVGNYSNGVDIVSYEPPFFVMAEPFPANRLTLRHPAVWSVLCDKAGTLWIGGENEILTYGDAGVERIEMPTLKRSIHSSCKALMRDRSGRLWVGTDNAGVYVYSPAQKSFLQIDIEPKEVRSLYEDEDGSVWIGTHDGLYKSTDGMTARYVSEYNSQLNDLFIMDILRDNDGRLWVGTYGSGAVAFGSDGGIEENLHADNGLPSNVVNSLYIDSRNNLWVGTRNGAAKMSLGNTSEIDVIDHSDGLINSDIKSIVEDADGNIWMSTNKGIACYDRDSEGLSVYQRTYLSPLSAFTERASCVGPDNRLFFGSQNGLVHFDADHKKLQPKNSKISLTAIVAHDSDASDHDLEIELPINSDNVSLPYNFNTFTLRFNNLDITQSSNSDFQYNMEGVNEVWTMADDNNEAIYRNLKPGDYKFQVRYRLNGQEWSEPQMLANITIEPPLYLTWWAKLLYTAVFVLIVLVVAYFYKRKLELEKNLAIEKETSKNNRLLNEERMVFFTNITHELRTPLSLIVGPIEDLVNDENLRDEHRKKLYTIRTSSMRLLNLINGILEFRKTETRNRKLEVIQGNLANFVREIGLRFKELNSNKKVGIVIDVSGMEGKEIYYDPDMINTIINNLMGNALKYTKNGSITLSLKPSVVQGVKYVDLAVSDTGVGISKDALPHVFQRYYQAENARKVSGTGIGLALTKNLVDLHEAEITVVSEEGKGSTFNVRFLMENSYPNAKHREVLDMEPGDGDETVKDAEPDNQLVLLVVEDDKDVRDYIADSFSDDFRVIKAADGCEGLEKARKELPDIVVSDIMMPEMDGIELCKTLKSEIITSHIPVILLTAKDSITDKEEGYDSGADSYITKPFSAKLLRSRINNIVESRHRMAMRLFEPPISDSPDYPEATDGECVTTESADTLNPLDLEFITKFRAIIDENLDKEEIDMNFLCDKMCMSNSTLYRKVKSISNLTPNEFIRKFKLRKAAELLIEGEVALGDIPVMTGFSSAAYFRRLFKKEYGVSPTEYIQKSTHNKQMALSKAD